MAAGYTLTGTIQNLLGSADVGYVTIELAGFGTSVPAISSTALLVNLNYKASTNGSGAFSATLFGNDQITPSGTYYVITVFSNSGGQSIPLAYKLNGSGADLSTLTPITPNFIVPTGTISFANLTGNISVSQMNGGTGASSSTFWRGDGTWAPGGGGGAVASVFGRTGSVVAASNDYSFSQISGSVAASQLPNPSASTLGGVQSKAAVAHQFITSISTSGVPALAQPADADISFTDITTGNVSTSAHGFTPKLPNDVTKYLDGTGAYSVPPGSGGGGTVTAAINYVIDGGGSTPGTGVKGQINIPVSCTIKGWVLTADVSGSAVIDVLRSTYSGFPTTASIASSDKPTLASAQKAENLAVGVWTTAVTAGDQIQFNLNSVTTCTRLNLTINVTIP